MTDLSTEAAETLRSLRLLMERGADAAQANAPEVITLAGRILSVTARFELAGNFISAVVTGGLAYLCVRAIRRLYADRNSRYNGNVDPVAKWLGVGVAILAILHLICLSGLADGRRWISAFDERAAVAVFVMNRVAK